MLKSPPPKVIKPKNRFLTELIKNNEPKSIYSKNINCMIKPDSTDILDACMSYFNCLVAEHEFKRDVGKILVVI